MRAAGEIVVRLDIARVLLDRLAKGVLRLLEFAVLLKQGPKIVVDLRIDHALRQRFLIGVQRTVDVANVREALPRLFSASGTVG